MEWECFSRHAHLERVRHVHHVPLRSGSHELRICSRKPCYEGMYKRHYFACLRLMFSPNQLWHLFLTQALLVGIGSSMLYYPVISLTPVFFDRHRGFAMGIAMSGSGAGGLVLAPVTQSLLVRFGAPVTLRILGVWNFVICVAISFVIRPHPAYKPIRPSLALVKRGAFIFQVRTSARVCPATRPIRSAVVRGVFSSCWQHNSIILSDHILDVCAGLYSYRGQHALGCEQRRQQRGTRSYGSDG